MDSAANWCSSCRVLPPLIDVLPLTQTLGSCAETQDTADVHILPLLRFHYSAPSIFTLCCARCVCIVYTLLKGKTIRLARGNPWLSHGPGTGWLVEMSHVSRYCLVTPRWLFIETVYLTRKKTNNVAIEKALWKPSASCHHCNNCHCAIVINAG